jgi:hypothetical protein
MSKPGRKPRARRERKNAARREIEQHVAACKGCPLCELLRIFGAM